MALFLTNPMTAFNPWDHWRDMRQALSKLASQT